MKDPFISELSADFDGNERYPTTLQSATATARTTAVTLTNSIANTNQTNAGAGATRVWTLPRALTMKNQGFRVSILAAQIVRLLPVTGEKIWLAGSGVASKYLNIAGTIGNYADIWSDGTDWHCVEANGVITKEA